MHAPIAQLDRVTDYESVGRGFESLSAYQKKAKDLCDSWLFSYFLRFLKLHFFEFWVTFGSPVKNWVTRQDGRRGKLRLQSAQQTGYLPAELGENRYFAWSKPEHDPIAWRCSPGLHRNNTGSTP